MRSWVFGYYGFMLAPYLLLFVILFIFYVHLFIGFATQPIVNQTPVMLSGFPTTDAVRIVWHKVLTPLGESA